MSFRLQENDILAFERDGAVCLRGVFDQDFLAAMADGIAENMAHPGPYAAENVKEGEAGRFFDDYCNWQRIEAFRKVILHSPAAEVAAGLMRSNQAQIFHDHVLVKENATPKPTPWHQDSPYYFISGEQTVSFWVPLDPVKENTLRFIAGSHLWDKPVLPVTWLHEEEFYQGEKDFLPVPDPDAEPEKFPVVEWQMEPGDLVAFHYRSVHGARGNFSGSNRRAFSMRWLGDDARFARRPGRTSPPYPGHNMVEGQRLREDWFPILWPRPTSPVPLDWPLEGVEK
ncbi:phytanoyl-CoA dioxygenase family protein [Rhodovibrionaceae bacterium A322]